MASDDIKAHVRQTYQMTAAGYGTRSVELVAHRLVELARLQPGEE